MRGNTRGLRTWTCCSHLHHEVPGALVSQLPEAGDEALAGLAVGPARLQHGLALFHKLHDANTQHSQSHLDTSADKLTAIIIRNKTQAKCICAATFTEKRTQRCFAMTLQNKFLKQTLVNKMNHVVHCSLAQRIRLLPVAQLLQMYVLIRLQIRCATA